MTFWKNTQIICHIQVACIFKQTYAKTVTSGEECLHDANARLF